MPIPLLPLITGAITAFTQSKVGQAKLPGFAQNIGQLTTSKTNGYSVLLVTYAISILSNEPTIVQEIVGNAIIVSAGYATFMRDTKFKK